MTRFDSKTSRILTISIVLSTLATFIADHFSPLGIAIYMIYMVPLALTFFTWRPSAPYLAAAVATILIMVDFYFTPSSDMTDGDRVGRAQLNRVFGIATLWMLAIIGNQFIKIRLEGKRENWLQTGQSKFGERIVGQKRMNELGAAVLDFLCDYLGAQAGAIFIEENSLFHQRAIRGVAAGSVPESFVPGDGLLGQAARDGKQAVVHELPEGYLTIGSSLGSGKPRQLLIAPVSLEGAVCAVIELGFFGKIRGSDEELIKRLEFKLGTAIRSVKASMRVQELLEETQQQSEEVQAQSEELRVSNEELEEQGRALRESQARLELQQAELEQINTQLEEQTQLLETQRNDLLSAKVTLENQARTVEQASRYKSDFLANMSHELRTPLNSSLILAKLLSENRSGNLSEDEVKFASTIEAAGNDLLALINDILDLSKIEAGRMEVHPEPVKLERLIKNLQGTFEPVTLQKGIELRFDVLPGAPDSIQTDPQRLEQVLKNLLSNAVKFTEKGTVSLLVGAAPEGRVAFAVSDTGIGIPQEKQRIIFDPFFQADGTTNRKYGGTGLGLSISRNLARLLGGAIDLASEPGRGSVFTVTLPDVYQGAVVMEDPVQSVASVSLAPSGRPPTGGIPLSSRVEDDRETLTGSSRVILSVEDDSAFAGIVRDLAHEMNFQCLIAGTAEEAVIMARQYLPSAIVLDVGLPDTSGLTVLERLKGDNRTRHIPVHVVSASDYTQTAMALGAVGYMLKPVKREQLAETFRKLESRLDQKMRRVLVVEDDPVQMEAMRHLLGSRDVDARCVSSVAECLTSLESTTFDCMVLDLSLPDGSGFSLLEKLSAEDAYAFPPVIVYTGRELSSAEEQRLRLYSKSIIIKGAKSPERLLDEVTLFLHQVVSDLPPEQQRMLEKSGNRDADLEGRRILIAEDDIRNVFALTSLLERRGVKLTIARNGREAITALDDALLDPAKTIDLVLMDIMMPEMDGLTAMRGIRARREWKKLPIIALTAKAMKNDQKECLAAGANDYLAKPLDVEKLLSLIRVWMPR